ncbi:unnamed protein product, partial [Discosporangium mesarthrocarpum]
MDAFNEVPQTYLVVGGVALAAIVLVLISTMRREPKDAPPKVYLGIPIIGNIIAFIKGPLGMLDSCCKKYGYVFSLPMPGLTFTFLIGPEAQAPFFKLNDETMSQNEVYGRYTKPVFGKDVVYNSEPKKRNQQMQHMANGLRAARLKAYVPMIEKETRDFIKAWGDKGEINLLEALSELTIMTASRCLHGDDVREELFADVARLYHDMDEGITPLSVFFPYAPIPSHFKRDKARREMVSLLSKIIQKRRAEQAAETSALEKTDLLQQVFVDMKYKDGSRNTDDQVVGLLIALLFAGQHTSSITSCWTSMLTSMNPALMARLLEEQKSVLGSDKTIITSEHLGEMKLLHNCMRETLRMYPPLILLLRLAKKDFKVTSNGRSFTVPKGHLVGTSPYVAMRLPEVFPNPDK